MDKDTSNKIAVFMLIIWIFSMVFSGVAGGALGFILATKSSDLGAIKSRLETIEKSCSVR